ncbi:MAG: hypothetical protein U1E45_17145 [Geminicoccaceae bacterium]
MSSLSGIVRRAWAWAAYAIVIAVLPVSAAHATTTEKLIFDWNSPVTTAHHGFPRVGVAPGPSSPLSFNFPGFAEGTLYFRVLIRSQAVAQTMKLQWCAWQGASGPAQREACASYRTVFGSAGNMKTWSQPVSQMWNKTYNGVKIPPDWTKAMKCHGVAISNNALQAVSDYYTPKWHGEDPAKWFPLDLRFQVVIVQKGATFSGWSHYGN